MLGQILTGIILAAIGVVILKFHYQLKNLFGSWGWAEDKLGSGGTYTAWKLIGLGMMVFGVLWGTGTLGSLLTNVLGMFFSGTVTR